MNSEEFLKVTPSKVPRPSSTSSPANKNSSKKASKNAKITNFFVRVNSSLNKNSNSNSNHIDQSENHIDDLSKDASSSSMKAPCTGEVPNGYAKTRVGTLTPSKDYVFIVPSDDDTNASTTKGSQATSKRKRAPSLHSNNSKSSDGFILTTNNNNELGIGRKRPVLDNQQQHDGLRARGSSDSSSNQGAPSTPTTRSSGRDSRSRDSLPEITSKRLKVENNSQLSNQSNGQQSTKVVTRIQPTMISCRTKMVDFQSVPSDLNMPREQAQKLIERLFLVKMPEDFYLFWEFAKTINHRKPCSAFSHAQLKWNLVGPFDVLSGLITDFHGFSKESLLRHCRYYYDPPEFQTVIMKRDDQFTHYGYYRDEPQQITPIVAMNKANVEGQFHEVGDNLFTLLRSELETAIGLLSKSSSSQEILEPTFLTSSSRATKSISDNITPTKITPNNCHSELLGTPTNHKQSQLERAKAKQELTIIRDKLLDFCSSHQNISSESWSRTQARRARTSAKTFNSIGIVLPVGGDIEYRSLGVTDFRLRNILNRISECEEGQKSDCPSHKELLKIINCNIGMGLELGLDLFNFGDKFFHESIKLLLTRAYKLLGRPEFSDILKAHLDERMMGNKVSLLD